MVGARPATPSRRLAAVAIATLAALAAGCGGSTHGSATSTSAPGPTSTTALRSTTATSSVREVSVSVGSPPLTGTLTMPRGAGPFPAVVLVSGSGPNDQDETSGPNKPFRDLALGLADHGIATLRYDKRTHDYPTSLDPKTITATQEYVPDALAAITLLEHRTSIDPHRLFVLGHSQGGTFAPLIAKRAPRLAGVILAAASTEPFGAGVIRQVRYLATLPGKVGARAAAQLPEVERSLPMLDSPNLASTDPSTVLLGGVGPAYYLDLQRYDPVATAGAIPQPLLILQGERDYQVTVADDLDVWTNGLAKRTGVTVARFPKANHLFLDGTGAPTPVEYETPGHVDPLVISRIAAWVRSIH